MAFIAFMAGAGAVVLAIFMAFIGGAAPAAFTAFIAFMLFMAGVVMIKNDVTSEI